MHLLEPCLVEACRATIARLQRRVDVLLDVRIPNGMSKSRKLVLRFSVAYANDKDCKIQTRDHFSKWSRSETNDKVHTCSGSLQNEAPSRGFRRSNMPLESSVVCSFHDTFSILLRKLARLQADFAKKGASSNGTNVSWPFATNATGLRVIAWLFSPIPPLVHSHDDPRKHNKLISQKL